MRGRRRRNAILLLEERTFELPVGMTSARGRRFCLPLFLIDWLRQEYGGTYQIGHIDQYEVYANRYYIGIYELVIIVRKK